MYVQVVIRWEKCPNKCGKSPADRNPKYPSHLHISPRNSLKPQHTVLWVWNMNHTLQQIVLGWSNKGRARWSACSTHGRDEKCTESVVEKLEGKRLPGDQSLVGKILLNLILKKSGVKMWTGFILYLVGCSCEILWAWNWNLGLRKRQSIYWLAERL